MADQTRYSGTVKSYNTEKGWGFFECKETYSLYGTDIFVIRHTLPQGLSDYLIPGTPVSFSVVQGTKGMCATDVAFGGDEATDHQHAVGGGMPVSMPVSDSTKFEGVVKSYNPTKGYGFLTCPATDTQFGRDVFLGRQEVPNGTIEAGTSVSFDVFVGERGPTATNVVVCGAVQAQQPRANPPPPARYPVAQQTKPAYAAPPATPRQYAPQKTFESQPSWQMQTQNQWQNKGGKGQEMPAVAGEIKNYDFLFYGSVKTVDERGAGFISSDATIKQYGSDIPVLRTALETGGVKAGDAVRFTLAMGPRGVMAVNVGPVQQGPGDSDTMYSGTVKSYNDAKGYGFIVCNQETHAFSGDVFMSKSELHGGAVVKGDSVSFTVDVSTGRAVAHNISVAGQASAQMEDLNEWGAAPLEETDQCSQRASPY